MIKSLINNTIGELFTRRAGKIGVNIIFTIEPTFVTKFGMMRFEDMIAIDSKGCVKILTK